MPSGVYFRGGYNNGNLLFRQQYRESLAKQEAKDAQLNEVSARLGTPENDQDYIRFGQVVATVAPARIPGTFTTASWLQVDNRYLPVYRKTGGFRLNENKEHPQRGKMPQDLKNFLMGFKGSNDPESVNSMKNVSNNRLRIEVHLVMEGNTVIKHTYAAYWALPKEESVSGPETKPGGKN